MKKLIFILSMLFAVAEAQEIQYTPMAAAGYRYKYVLADSGFHVPFRDTTVGHGSLRPGAIICYTGDSALYAWNGIQFTRIGVGISSGSQVDSVIITTDQICVWFANVATCSDFTLYFAHTTPNFDTTRTIYLNSNYDPVDSSDRIHTRLWAQYPALLTDTLDGDKLFSLQVGGYCDSTYHTPDSIWIVTLNCDGSIRDSTKFVGIGIDSALITVEDPLVAPTGITLKFRSSFLDSLRSTMAGNFGTRLLFNGIYAGIGGSLTTSNNSLSIGQGAGSALLAAGSYSTFIGYGAGQHNTTAVGNTGIGATALAAVVDGGENSAVGSFSLLSLTSGFVNSAFGSASLAALTTGSENVAFGYRSQYLNVAANRNASFGAYSLMSQKVGIGNLAFGWGASQYDTAASFKTSFGYEGGKYYGLDTNYSRKSTGSLFIGSYRPHASVNNDTNQVVLASGRGLTWGGIGSGNYTVTVGDSLNTKVNLWGKVTLTNSATASATYGTATLSSGTVTVSTTAVTSSSQIWVQYNGSVSTISSVLTTPTITNGVSFVITALTPGSTSTASTDNNTVKWWIIN